MISLSNLKRAHNMRFLSCISQTLIYLLINCNRGLAKSKRNKQERCIIFMSFFIKGQSTLLKTAKNESLFEHLECLLIFIFLQKKVLDSYLQFHLPSTPLTIVSATTTCLFYFYTTYTFDLSCKTLWVSKSTRTAAVLDLSIFALWTNFCK